MSIYITIAVGGSFGAVLRYWLSSTTNQLLGSGFPYGTLAVNILGSILMGFLSVVLLHRFNLSDELRTGFLVGFLGSFTTFSAFAMDTLFWLESGDLIKSLSYVLLSVFFCILGCWAGLLTARQII